MRIDLLLDIFAKGLLAIDSSGVPFRNYQPGVGPYSEPELLKRIKLFAEVSFSADVAGIATKRYPDLLIPRKWAIEAKIVRPFGDNGVIAEHWSQNLLHPYEGNTGLIGDVYKLTRWPGEERKAVVAITYSHNPAQVDLSVIIEAFEILSRDMLKLPLGDRHTLLVDKLIHPVHQQAAIFGWEVFSAP